LKGLFLGIAALMITIGANAQVKSPVRWSYASKKISATEAVVFLKATIDKDWHIYSQTGKAAGR
jgi:hypothetical protein